MAKEVEFKDTIEAKATEKLNYKNCKITRVTTLTKDNRIQPQEFPTVTVSQLHEQQQRAKIGLS